MITFEIYGIILNIQDFIKNIKTLFDSLFLIIWNTIIKKKTNHHFIME